MPDNEMLEDLEFENQITAMGDNQTELIKFVARQQYSSGKTVASLGKRVKSLENKNKKTMGAVGGVSAVVAGIIVAAVDYFLKRGS